MLKVIERFEVASEWTIFGDDTENKSISTSRIEGNGSLHFDKVSGQAGTGIAGCYRALDGQELKHWYPQDKIVWHINVPMTKSVTAAFLRLGADASNYAEWRVLAADLAGGALTFNHCAVPLGDCTLIKAGIDLNNFRPVYMAVGVIFANAAAELADILVDYAYLLKARSTI